MLGIMMSKIKEPYLTRCLLLFIFFLYRTHLGNGRNETGTISEIVQCSGEDQGFQCFFIDNIPAISLDELIDGGIGGILAIATD